MLHVFSKSSIGYSHIKEKCQCQDFSAVYKDPERTIITCCDGHGGKKYIRSHIGSHMASNAIINVFNSIHPSFFRLKNEEIENKIKLSILCEWNKLVEEQISYKSIKKNELINLDEDEILSLKSNPAIAYGTTLTGALLLGNKLLVVKIGDTECVGIRKGQLIDIFDSSDDPAANVTYSMCQDDAFFYLKVKVLDFRDLDGIVLCTDGLTSPYQSYDNFKNSFIKPMINKIVETKSLSYIDEFIDEVASQLGVGDDVSLSFILNDNITKKYYK